MAEFSIAKLLGDDGAHAGILDASLAFLVAGVQVVGSAGVSAFAGAHAADDGGMVDQTCELWEMLTDLDAGNRRLDLAIRTAVRRFGTEVEGVLVAWAACHPQKDAGLGRLPGFRGAGSENIEPVGGRKAEHAGGGEFHPFATLHHFVEHG